MTKSHLHIYSARTSWTRSLQGRTSERHSDFHKYTETVADKQPLKGAVDSIFWGETSLYKPERLLVMSLSSSHMLSYLNLCDRAGILVFSYIDEAIGKMIRKDGKIHFLEAILRPQVTIESKDNLEAARDLHHQASQDCFIANSVAFPVLHEPTICFNSADA